MAHRSLCLIGALAALLAGFAGHSASAEQLGFSQALEMVFGHHEGLKALKQERAAAEQAVRQASAYLNPEVEVETRDWGRAEVEVLLTQPIFIGGQRGAAIDVAKQEAEMAELRLQSLQVSLEAELIRRFAPVLAADQRLSLIDSMIEVSAGNVGAVRRLVKAGATNEVDALRAELERDELMLERLDLERSLAEAQIRLSALWGDEAFRFEGVQGTLPISLPVPTLKELGEAMEDHPEVLLLDAEAELVRSEMNQARAEGRPEFALSAGYYVGGEGEEEGPIASAALSLPIFNRNKGAVAEKEHAMAAAQHEGRQIRLERSSDLLTTYAQFETSGRKLTSLSGDVLARAAQIHQKLQDFYLQGRTGILDVLAGRAHLLETQMRIVDITEHRALLAADLQELSGYPIEVIH